MIDELEFEELKDRMERLETIVNKSNFSEGLSALSVELKKGANEFIDLAATQGKQNEQAYSIIAGVLGGLSNAIRDASERSKEL